MWEWLVSPIDPSRAHEVGFAISWHGRAMVLAWGILAPLAVLVARYLKILPGQDWPNELDRQLWWRGHWLGQSAVLVLTVLGVGLILTEARGQSLHGALGYSLLGLLALQIALGVVRGTKGGPTDATLRGDHYDMTPWRRMFEAVHKTLGYSLIALGALTVILGLWHANGPRWMWLVLLAWWLGVLAVAVVLQRRGWAADTYEAIWGPGLEHPGNRMPGRGWGMRRRSLEGVKNVRND